MAPILALTVGAGAVLMALGFVGIYLGRRRGRPKSDVSLLTAVLLVAGFVVISIGAATFR